MYSEVKIEGLVIGGIKEFREKGRKRVNKKDLFYYVEEVDENLMQDINDFYDTIDNMVEKCMIYNSNLSGDELKDPYFVSKELEMLLDVNNRTPANPLNNRQSFNLSSTQQTPPLSKNYKTPAVTTSSKNKKKNKITINMLNDIVSKKVDECMKPFVEKINFLFDKLNLQTEISIQTQTDNSITIARLQEENKFIKPEIQLKNEVIRIIRNERKTMEERTNKTCETTVDNTNTVVTEKIHSRKINATVVDDSIVNQMKPNQMRNNGNIKAHVNP